MKKLLNSLIRNRKITLLFMVVILLAGIVTYYFSPKQDSPDLSIPYAMITTVYPGASQGDVERQVTSVIENNISQMKGYNTSFSYSSSNISVIIVELAFDVNREQAFIELDNIIVETQKEIPEQALNIKVNNKITEEASVILSLSSDAYTYEQLNDYAKELGEILDSIKGVEKFVSKGLINEQVVIEVDTKKIELLSLSLQDIVNIVNINNIMLPYGKVENDGEKISVNINESYKSIEDIKQVIIGFNQVTKQMITLNDVANIYKESKSSDTYYIFNDQPTILLTGTFEDNQNILLIGDEIKEEIKIYKEQLPNDILLTEILFQPDEVAASINQFMMNLLLGIALVIIVVFLGMGGRNAIIISISIPMSILMSISLMKLVSIPIHHVSIAALIVSLGMLVDNSIVVSDAIQDRLDKGQKRMKACTKGVLDVAIPIGTSTLTTIAAFTPFLFLNSMAGDYIKSLPQIVIMTLAASYVVAILFIPVLGYMFFKKRKNKKEKSIVARLYTAVLKKGLKVKWVVILSVLLAVAGTAFLATQLDVIFFPASDKDIIYIDIINNDSNDLESTRDITIAIGEILDDEESISYYVSSIGGGLPRFNKIMYIYSAKPDVSQIMLRVDLEKGDFKTNEELVSDLQDRISNSQLEAKITVKQLMYAFPMDEDVNIRIRGNDITKVKEYETVIYNMVSNKEGMLNVTKSNSDYIMEYVLDINEDKLAINGLTLIDVQNQLSIASLGRTSTKLIENDYEKEIIIRCNIEKLDDLLQVSIYSPIQNKYIKLATLITVREEENLSTIQKYDSDYALSIKADYDLAYDKHELLKSIKEEIDLLSITDCDITYEGEDTLIRENFGQIGILAIIAAIAVFLILLVQFKSYIQPLIIFMTIPLSAIGSVLGLYITNQPISFTALLGIVSLLGIVVNNAIILIAYINHQTAIGVTIKKACINATNRRLRPIFLSTITTIIGLIPLAFSTSQLFKPMAIALMSGLLVSTLLTLIVIPILISIGNKQINIKNK